VVQAWIVKPIFEVFHTKQPSADYLVSLQREQANLPATYTEIGGTLAPELPGGWHHLKAVREVAVPLGADGFARGKDAIRTWAAQRELQLVLEPTCPPILEGSVLVFALPMKPSGFWATGACRIVKVVDEPNRFGFVYGTLPHHPECGEEAFLVSRDPAQPNRVTFSITAFSRGAKLPMKVSGPIGRLIQRRAAETYLTGYEKSVLATEEPNSVG
jgi:uncharacterized protein (UPF0548 family)